MDIFREFLFFGFSVRDGGFFLGGLGALLLVSKEFAWEGTDASPSWRALCTLMESSISGLEFLSQGY